jgi:hypothetical protein
MPKVKTTMLQISIKMREELRKCAEIESGKFGFEITWNQLSKKILNDYLKNNKEILNDNQEPDHEDEPIYDPKADDDPDFSL